jgi:uncharacterized membrane protein SpoIIM required for sporulation
MVVESIIDPLKAKKDPWKMVFVGFLYATIGLMFSLWIFNNYASLVMVFLTALCCAPLMYATIKNEEEIDLENTEESKLLWEHIKVFNFLIFLFIGITLGFTFWYLALPPDITESVFSVQEETIASINGKVIDGNFVLGEGFWSKSDRFMTIFLNNVKVAIFCVIFAFTFGLGAIFILVWNSSVIAAALANFIKLGITEYATATGLVKVAGYFNATSWGFMRYGIHGIPEILAYFVAGLAGGIVSIAIMKRDFRNVKIQIVLLDAVDLILISIVILMFAGIIETWITPLFF